MGNTRSTEGGDDDEQNKDPVPTETPVTPQLTQEEALRQAHEALATIQTLRTETAERLDRSKLGQTERQKELEAVKDALDAWDKAKTRALEWKNHGKVAQYLAAKIALMPNADRLERKYRELKAAYELKYGKL